MAKNEQFVRVLTVGGPPSLKSKFLRELTQEPEFRTGVEFTLDFDVYYREQNMADIRISTNKGQEAPWMPHSSTFR
ncbi:MAG: hypothetical protein ACFFFG_17905 [Candidatus Thorarchaeota archaeon]